MNKIENENQELDLEELNIELGEVLDHDSDRENSTEDRPEREHRSKRHSGSRRKKRRRRRKKKSAFRIFLTVLIVIACILAALVIGFFVLRYLGEKKLEQPIVEAEITVPDTIETEVEAEISEDGKTVIYNGEKYHYNEELITILCMGIDRSINSVGEDNIGENGQADTIFLAVFDKTTGKMSVVNISRDTMIDVNKYNVNGEFTGIERMQLCLAYAYGDGKATSCDNIAESVSRLIYGIPINGYAAIDYSGISVLNDTVGGVEVEVLEDLSAIDPELSVGNVVRLSGDQAHTYVRSRDTAQLDSNNARMSRQKQFLFAFIQTAISQARSNIGIVYSLFQNLNDYMVTDMGVGEAVYLATLVMDTGFAEGDMKTVPGEVIQGETYAEFIPDEKGLYELILDVFYVNE